MSENNLIIEVDFEDVEEGCGVYIYEIGKFTSDDGSCISYETISCEDIVPTWDDKDTFNAAVDFFEKFLSDVDRKKLRKWVKNNVTHTDIFENTDNYEKILGCLSEFGDDPFVEFCVKFSPDTDAWAEFN